MFQNQTSGIPEHIEKKNYITICVIGRLPKSSVPNSSKRSVSVSLNSIIPCAGIAICDRIWLRGIV